MSSVSRGGGWPKPTVRFPWEAGGEARREARGRTRLPLGTAEARGKPVAFWRRSGARLPPPDTKHDKLRAARSLVVDSPQASHVWFLFEQAIF